MEASHTACFSMRFRSEYVRPQTGRERETRGDGGLESRRRAEGTRRIGAECGERHQQPDVLHDAGQHDVRGVGRRGALPAAGEDRQKCALLNAFFILYSYRVGAVIVLYPHTLMARITLLSHKNTIFFTYLASFYSPQESCSID